MNPLIFTALLTLQAPSSAPVGVYADDAGWHRAARVSMVAVAVAQAADVLTTQAALKRGGVESNPIIGRVVGSPAKLWIVKGGATVAIVALIEILRRKHPKVAAVTGFLIAGGTGYIAWRNTQVGR